MKTTSLSLSALLVVLACAQVQADPTRTPAPKPAPPEVQVPPPVVLAPPPPLAPQQVYVYDQKPLPGRPVLVQPQQAQAIIDRFKAGYPKIGNPRMLIYVNRELVDENSGLKIIARTEKIDRTKDQTKSAFEADPNFKGGASGSNGINLSAGGNLTVGGDLKGDRQLFPGKGETSSKRVNKSEENRYRLNERKEAALADKQTVRDVERLFGRPLRMGGATLTDQRLATQLIPDKSFKSLNTEGEAARKDREALSKITEIVIEVLISSKNIQVSEVAGDRIYAVPDIQATALRLSDAKIMGQSSSSDIIGKERYASYIARTFDVREIAEATALALMEDLMTGVEVAQKAPETKTP